MRLADAATTRERAPDPKPACASTGPGSDVQPPHRATVRTVITAERRASTLGIDPGSLLRLLLERRQLVAQLAMRQVESRFRGSLLGRCLVVINPLLLLGVYTLVFTTLIPLPGAAADRLGFTLQLFGSLLLYQVFAETVARAPSLVVGNASYVKRVVFPLEVLPLAELLASAVVALGGFVVLLIALASTGRLTITAIAFPLLLPPLFAVTAGAAWFLASLGVYVRDLTTSIAVVLTVILYLTPVFYEVGTLGAWRWVAELNPLAAVVESGKRALGLGLWPEWRSLAWSWLWGAVIACLGFAWFRLTKRGFADVV